MSPARRRRFAKHAQRKLGVSERRACKAIGQPHSTQRYEPTLGDDQRRLVARILELSHKHKRYGHRSIHTLLVRGSWRVNRKAVLRVWRADGLKVPQKQRERRRVGNKDGSSTRPVAEHPNHVWAIDFKHDQTADGRPIKILVAIDEFTRENLVLRAGRSNRSGDVIDALARQVAKRGAPEFIRADNGPEFVADALRTWLPRIDIQTSYIEPGSSWQNPFVESFNGKLADELLDREVFETLAEANAMLDEHRYTYNHDRPHSSLGYHTPAEFAQTSSSDRLGPTALTGQTTDRTTTPTLMLGGS